MITKRTRFLLAILFVVMFAFVVNGATATQTAGTFNTTYALRSTGTHVNGATETTTLKCANQGTCVAGTYEVRANIGVTAGTGSGTATLTISVADGTATRTMALTGIDISSTSSFTSSAGTFDYAGSGTLTAGMAVAGGSGTSSFYYNVVIRRIRQ